MALWALRAGGFVVDRIEDRHGPVTTAVELNTGVANGRLPNGAGSLDPGIRRRGYTTDHGDQEQHPVERAHGRRELLRKPELDDERNPELERDVLRAGELLRNVGELDER